MKLLPLLTTTLSFSIASAASVQKPGLVQSELSKQRADEVKQLFSRAYNAYRAAAFGHDELKPISNSSGDSRNGWGATIVDSLDTMLVMNLTDFYNEGVEFVKTIDFSKSRTSDPTVSVFETTIRYLGGLLSAYELSGFKDQVLLQKAQQLGDKLAYAWSQGTAVPYNTLDFSTNEPKVETTGIAVAGTLILEFSKLSKYTENDTYVNLASSSEKAVIGSKPIFPGLYAQGFDPKTNETVDDYVTFGGGSDSFFEYLVKYAYLTGNADPLYLQTWLDGVDSAIVHLAKETAVGDWTYFSDFSQSRGGSIYVFSHLACYVGGNWILGGKLVNNDTIVDYGLKLVDSCHNSYESTTTHIGPESFAYIGKDQPASAINSVPANQKEFYDEHGFYITNGYYILRPEVVESMWYAYRVTGDPKYQDWVYDAFTSLKKYCYTPVSYASLQDVNPSSVDNIQLFDDSESFFYAEVLKYFYLTFADPDLINLDKYTLNTEAHPYLLDAEWQFDDRKDGNNDDDDDDGGDNDEVTPSVDVDDSRGQLGFGDDEGADDDVGDSDAHEDDDDALDPSRLSVTTQPSPSRRGKSSVVARFARAWKNLNWAREAR